MLEKLRQVCLAFRIADNLVSYEELKTGNSGIPVLLLGYFFGII